MMRLLSSATSPYARKARAVVLEHALADRVAFITIDATGQDAEMLRAHNPLGKIPTLVLDDGTALYDSPVICEYLDSIAGGARLLPPDGIARFRAMRVVALADGIMDAALNLVLERRRPEPQRSPDWSERWTGAILRAVAALAPDLDDTFDMGSLAAACALGYLDFRLDDLAWRAHAPALAPWFAAVAQRPCLAATAPPAPGRT